MASITRAYDWPARKPLSVNPAPPSAAQRKARMGRYRFERDSIEVYEQAGRLLIRTSFGGVHKLIPVSVQRFVLHDTGTFLELTQNTAGAITGLLWNGSEALFARTQPD